MQTCIWPSINGHVCVCVLNGLISDSLTLVHKLRDTVVGFIFLLLSALEVFLTLRHDNNRAYSFIIIIITTT